MAVEPTLITSFFTNGGAPATGLTPTINIWEVTAGSEVLVVNGASMTESAGGWYKYNFTTYDTAKDYLIRTDGGGTLANEERYQAFANESFSEDIADQVWEEAVADHLNAGTFGHAMGTTDSDIEALRLDVDSLLVLAEILLKFETNRTKVDKVAKTLTVYDDNGTTPLHVFDLLDGTGTPSVDEIAERVPQ